MIVWSGRQRQGLSFSAAVYKLEGSLGRRLRNAGNVHERSVFRHGKLRASGCAARRPHDAFDNRNRAAFDIQLLQVKRECQNVSGKRVNDVSCRNVASVAAARNKYFSRPGGKGLHDNLRPVHICRFGFELL